MGFAIEVPGEANPLSRDVLCHVLQAATSNYAQQIKSGAQQLQNWETTPGFYSTLQEIYIDFKVPIELRYLAVIQLKNGIDKYWRKTALNAINKDEKDLVRSRLIDSAMREPDPRIALQISVVIAKIIRYDYPKEWPDAINSTLHRLRAALLSGSSLYASRMLLILLHTTKALASARLVRHRASLSVIAPEILAILISLYFEKASTWLVLLKNSGDVETGALGNMDESFLALRTLRRLSVNAYDFPNRHQDIKDLWPMLASQFGEMLAAVHQGQSKVQDYSKFMIEKHMLQISKLYLTMMKEHPAAFILLPDSMNIVKAYWNLARQVGESMGSQGSYISAETGTNDNHHVEDSRSTLEILSLHALILIRACLKFVHNPTPTFKYNKVEDREEKKVAQGLLKDSLLSISFAQEIMENLITSFFVFSPQDLRHWEDCPEEWERTQEGTGEDSDISLRTCSEKLFLDLTHYYKELLVHPLIAFFRTVADIQNTDILLKDSLYCAIGLAAAILDRFPDFSFGYFLENTLMQEVQVERTGYNILRRRIAIVLGLWLPIREGLNRRLVYQIFQHLLDRDNPLNDLVVRITAGKQLKHVIDPFEFTTESFILYVPVILDRVMALVLEVEQVDTKRQLLNTVEVIVTKMEQEITPYTDQIISLLVPLWDQAAEEPLMQQTILGLLCALATSMQAESRRYHQRFIPLIQSSIDPSSESSFLHLVEDGLELLSIVLTQTSSDDISIEILSLVQFVFPLYDLGAPLKKLLEITELYIFLIPAEILSNVSVLLSPLVSLLRNSKHEGRGPTTYVVELLIRHADNIGGLQAVSDLAQALLSSKWISLTISALHRAYTAHQNTGPRNAYHSIDGVEETDFLNPLARLAVASPSLFISALDASEDHNEKTEVTKSHNQVLPWMLTEWFSHMDSIGHPVHKKLNCLALTSILGTGQPWILDHLQSLITVWTDVITELVVDVSQQEDIVDKRDCLVYTDPDASRPEGTESPADLRKRMLDFKDPVHQTDIRVFVRETLATAIETCGGMETFQRDWVQNVDKDVIQGFQALEIL